MVWLLILAVVAIAAVLYKLKFAPKKEIDDLTELTLDNIKTGDMVSIVGFGDNFEDIDFMVDKINKYTSSRGIWFEAMIRHKDKRIWLEWEDDTGELFITASKSRKADSLSKLNLTEEDLIRFDKEDLKDNSFNLHGKNFNFQFSGEAFFLEDRNEQKKEGYYLWDFISEDELEVISIEKWEDESYEVYYGHIIPEYNITIYRK